MTTAILICPGRGTYNQGELGTLARTFPDPALLAAFDAARAARGEDTLSDLDSAARFCAAKHARGDNASGLIFAAGYGDAQSIADDIEIVAVTGNSMGWYTTLACGGAVRAEDGFDIATTMGRKMHEAGAGGQILYPHMSKTWEPDAQAKADLLALVDEIGARAGCRLSLSIDLGGTLVLAGDDAGLAAFAAAVPQKDGFPMRLPGHAGFHSPLVAPVSEEALGHFSPALLRQPKLPLIDGRGQIWWPHAADLNALWHYTFGDQVTRPYDFTRAITVAAREFAPDLFIITGPGTTLGSSVAQSLIAANWRGMACKSDFQKRQAEHPLLIAMGRDDQRRYIAQGQ